MLRLPVTNMTVAGMPTLSTTSSFLEAISASGVIRTVATVAYPSTRVRPGEFVPNFGGVWSSTSQLQLSSNYAIIAAAGDAGATPPAQPWSGVLFVAAAYASPLSNDAATLTTWDVAWMRPRQGQIQQRPLNHSGRDAAQHSCRWLQTAGVSSAHVRRAVGAATIEPSDIPQKAWP